VDLREEIKKWLVESALCPDHQAPRFWIEQLQISFVSGGKEDCSVQYRAQTALKIIPGTSAAISKFVQTG
jgi:hypothetical protein